MDGITSLLKISLAQMAAQANLTALSKNEPVLPNQWVNIGKVAIKDRMPAPVPVAQGFLALGPIDDEDNQGYVLALGMSWNTFLLNQFSGSLLQARLPNAIAGSEQPADSLVSLPHTKAYQQVRSDIWDKVGAMKAGLPLYICGMGLGAPLAQIAALDLRPGNKGPSQQGSRISQAPSYVFSSINFVNQVFANYYNDVVSNATYIWAGTKALPVDLFPTSPDSNNFAPMGKLQSIDCSIPSGNNAGWLKLPSSSQPYDLPWLERSDIFYLKCLGGIPVSSPAIPVSIPRPPAGFSQVTASAMTVLAQAAYQLSRDPMGNIGNITPYKFEQSINYKGKSFAFIFQSANATVVVFRGTVTWEEFIALEANSNLDTPSFSTNGRVKVHSGAYTIYSGPVDNSSKALTFAQTLRDALTSLVGKTALYFTGHGLGGAVATIATADYAMSGGSLKPEALYTFGATLPGNYDFEVDFDAAFNKCYQIIRPKDKIPTAVMTLGFSTVGNAVTLNGELAVDESTFHSLFGYLVLLNPAGSSNVKTMESAEKGAMQRENNKH